MIRFLNLKNQICEGEPSFAFYNTVSDQVVAFYGQQVFDTIEDFEYHFVNSRYSNDETYDYDRFVRLIPDDFFTT